MRIRPLNQALVMSREAYAAYFGIPAENVLIRSPFLGGGFGSKAILNGPQLLAMIAARHLKRPVKLALSRGQMYGPVGHRGRTWQRLRLGLDGAGHLTAIHHHSIAATSSFEDFLEPDREVLVAHDGDGVVAHLRDLDAVRQARAVMVALMIHENLRLELQAAKGARVNDPVAVTLEGAARFAGRFLI